MFKLKNLKPWLLHHHPKAINLWPPYLGAGIRIRDVAKDFTDITVEMKLRPWNRNYVGTQFGGSIYAMTDPFYMLMLIENLGPDYIVWDKGANINFKKPGKGTLTAHFNLTKAQIADIKAAADANYKTEPTFDVEIKDDSGAVIAEVHKILYVRRKDRVPRGPG